MKNFFKNYEIREINKGIANQIYLKHHYTGTTPVSTFSVGLFINDELIGAISFGPSATPKMAKSISPLLTEINYLELQRLFIFDVTAKNTESWFISASIKLLKKKYPYVNAIISFADPSVGHMGTIYQACNFLYLGTSSPHIAYIDKTSGKLKHNRSLSKLKKKGSKKYDDFKTECNYEAVKKQGKHRYLLIINDRIKYYKDIDSNELIPISEIHNKKSEKEISEQFEMNDYNKPKVYTFSVSKNLKRIPLSFPKSE